MRRRRSIGRRLLAHISAGRYEDGDPALWAGVRARLRPRLRVLGRALLAGGGVECFGGGDSALAPHLEDQIGNARRHLELGR